MSSEIVPDIPDPKLSLTRTNLPIKKVPVVRVKMDVHIKPENLFLVYSNIMIAFMKDLDEDKFLALVQADPTIEDIFLRNKAFGTYLSTYRPNEYTAVVRALSINPNNMKQSIENYTVYDMHRKLFPEDYSGSPGTKTQGKIISSTFGKTKKPLYFSDTEFRQSKMF